MALGGASCANRPPPAASRTKGGGTGTSWRNRSREREGRFCTRTWGVGTGVEGSSRRRLLSREEDVGVGIGSPDILAGDVGSLTHESDFTHQRPVIMSGKPRPWVWWPELVRRVLDSVSGFGCSSPSHSSLWSSVRDACSHNCWSLLRGLPVRVTTSRGVGLDIHVRP
jgi:hypothetical protein